MKTNIDPMVDCVFKAILGREENKDLLMNFLNAMLGLEKRERVEKVDILNPYNEKEYFDSKVTVVDIKAMDGKGRTFQLEVQCGNGKALKSRALYSWAQTYCRSIGTGEDFEKLKPTVAIWLLRDSLFPQTDAVHLQFRVCDLQHSISLTKHLAIHMLQLKKFQDGSIMKTDKERWLNLFKNGENLDGDQLPDGMNTKIIWKAVKVMRTFTEEEMERDIYERQRMGLYWYKAEKYEWEKAIEEERKLRMAAEDEALKVKEAQQKAQEEERRVAALELDRLRDLLRQAGVDPNPKIAAIPGTNLA